MNGDALAPADPAAIVADRLSMSMGPGARVLRGAGVLAVAWPYASATAREPGSVRHGSRAILLRHGEVLEASLPGTPTTELDADALTDVPAAPPWRHLRSLRRRRDIHGDALAAVAEIARGGDVAALHAYVASAQTGADVLDWLSSRHPDAAAVQAFAVAHPWLVAAAAALPPSIREAGARGPDVLASAVLSSLARLPPGEPARIAARMRGFAMPGVPDGGAVEALAALPDATLAWALMDGDAGARLRLGAVHALASLVHVLADATGRTHRSLVGEPCPAEGYMPHLAGRAGHDPASVSGAGGAVHGIADMIASFASDVLAPARLLVGLAPPDEDCDVAMFPRHLLDARNLAATRLLVGERTLPALAEVSHRWHRRADGIARDLAAATEGMVGEGPRLFPDHDLGNGHFLTCLCDVRSLVDEGAPGPDGSGAPGLDHCVGSYAERVVEGRTHVVSVRRRLPYGGYARVSTAEIVPSDDGPGWKVAQHMGRGNSEPDRTTCLMLSRGLMEVGDDAALVAAAFVPAEDAWPGRAAIVARPGGWEAMRDAWAFALPRPARGLGPRELLAAGGETHG